MAIHCFAPDCKHNNRRDTCSFFGFPKDVVERDRWKKMVRRDKEPGPNASLCSCHFRDGKKQNGPTELCLRGTIPPFIQPNSAPKMIFIHSPFKLDVGTHVILPEMNRSDMGAKEIPKDSKGEILQRIIILKQTGLETRPKKEASASTPMEVDEVRPSGFAFMPTAKQNSEEGDKDPSTFQSKRFKGKKSSSVIEYAGNLSNGIKEEIDIFKNELEETGAELENSSVASSFEQVKNEDGTYDCKQCPYQADRPFQLANHLQRSRHGYGCADELFNAAVEPEQYRCACCAFRSHHKLDMYKHDGSFYEHFRRFPCDHCNYKGHSSLSFLKHHVSCKRILTGSIECVLLPAR